MSKKKRELSEVLLEKWGPGFPDLTEDDSTLIWYGLDGCEVARTFSYRGMRATYEEMKQYSVGHGWWREPPLPYPRPVTYYGFVEEFYYRLPPGKYAFLPLYELFREKYPDLHHNQQVFSLHVSQWSDIPLDILRGVNYIYRTTNKTR